MKKYELEKCGNRYYTIDSVKGITGIVVIDLLIDTGSTYTILPWEVMEKIGRRSSYPFE